jgi:hypothetical protein
VDLILFLSYSSGAVTPSLANLKDAFPVILSSYSDFRKNRQHNCLVSIDQSAQNHNEAWNISETRMEAVRWASSLLFLAAWAENEYFTCTGYYANDTLFHLYFQRFTKPIDFVSLSYRKRDGSVLYGGPKHGELLFTKPLHCPCSSCCRIDLNFLASLNNAHAAKSSAVEGLKAVLPLVRLANTDSDGMTINAEMALMGFAFEQYFQADKARSLADKFDSLFGGYGKTTARAAQTQRPGIYPDPRYTQAQLDWFVGKIWMLEFHQYRSTVAHGGSLSGRTWGGLPSSISSWQLLFFLLL